MTKAMKITLYCPQCDDLTGFIVVSNLTRCYVCLDCGAARSEGERKATWEQWLGTVNVQESNEKHRCSACNAERTMVNLTPFEDGFVCISVLECFAQAIG